MTNNDESVVVYTTTSAQPSEALRGEPLIPTAKAKDLRPTRAWSPAKAIRVPSVAKTPFSRVEWDGEPFPVTVRKVGDPKPGDVVARPGYTPEVLDLAALRIHFHTQKAAGAIPPWVTTVRDAVREGWLSYAGDPADVEWETLDPR